MRWSTCLVLAALALGACADPSYCDDTHPCKDARYPTCNVPLRECQAGAVPDGGLPDSGQADHAAGDAGCGAGSQACAGRCYAVDDPAHCGATCRACPSDPNGDPACSAGACGFACHDGYYASSTACAVCTVPEHCGPTCAACPAVTNGALTCSAAGVCGYTCHDGFYDDGTACSPCNVTDHCGSACAPCSGTTPACAADGSACVCVVDSCGAGATPICDSTTFTCRACGEHGECASGACDLATGRCVAETDVIYLSSATSCPSANGTRANPYCDFPTARGAVNGTRFRIVASAGTYRFTSTQLISSGRVMVIGTSAGSTALETTGVGSAAINILNSTELDLFNITVKGGTTPQGDGVQCTGTGPGATLFIVDSIIGPNLGVGVNAKAACSVTLLRSQVVHNGQGGVSLSTSNHTILSSLIASNGGGTSTFGGVYVSQPSATTVFINNTVVGNAASSPNAAGVKCADAASIVNSILWSNTNSQQSGCDVTYTDVQGGATGTGNLAADPLFVDVGAEDYHLQAGSPCINAGTSAGAPDKDLDGHRRSGAPDLGCYEAQ